MTDKNSQNMKVPERPQPTQADQRIKPLSDEEERMEREADKLAHKGIEREQEFDDTEGLFTE